MNYNIEHHVNCYFCGSNNRVMNTSQYSKNDYNFISVGDEMFTQVNQYEFACFECRKKYRLFKTMNLMQFILFNENIKEDKLLEAGIIISNNLLYLGDSLSKDNQVKFSVWKKEENFKVVTKKSCEQDLKDFFVKMKKKKLPVYVLVVNNVFIGVGVGPIRKNYLKFALNKKGESDGV